MPVQSEILQALQARINALLNTQVAPFLRIDHNTQPGIRLYSEDYDQPVIKPVDVVFDSAVMTASRVVVGTPVLAEGDYDMKVTMQSFPLSASHGIALEVFDAGGSFQIIEFTAALIATQLDFKKDFCIKLVTGQGIRLINDITADTAVVNGSIMLRKRLLTS